MKKIRSLSFDAKALKSKFKPSTAAEKRFYSSLKKVAQASGHIVEQHVEGASIKNPAQMQKALNEYAKALEPWARRQSKKLLETVSNSNKTSYTKSSQKLGRELNYGPANVQAQVVAEALQNEQVALIKSIPLEAGLRAQKIALEAVLHGTRAQPDEDTIKQLEDQLGMTTRVATSRARLIAVTETARANASFTQARAVAVGAKGYIWRATMDGATRKSHAEMDGELVLYSQPPTLSDGTKGHAGTFPNCRCYQDPVFDD